MNKIRLQRIDIVFRICGHVDNGSAEGLCDIKILRHRVDNDHIIISVKEHLPHALLTEK